MVSYLTPPDKYQPMVESLRPAKGNSNEKLTRIRAHFDGASSKLFGGSSSFRSSCVPNEIRERSKTDEMPPNAATPEPDDGVLGDLEGFQTPQGRDGGTISVSVNPRQGTAQFLADAVVLAPKSGDLVAAQAVAKALEAFVEALGKAEPHTVPDIGAERRSRGNNTA